MNLEIAKGVLSRTKTDTVLKSIKIIPIDTPSAFQEDNQIVSLVYDLTPEGVEFSPAISLTMFYDPIVLPENININSLYIAFFNRSNSQWNPLESILSEAESALTTSIDHFSIYALFGKFTPPVTTPIIHPLPANFIISDISVAPASGSVASVDKKTLIVSAKATNIGGIPGECEVTLKIDGAVENTRKVSIDPGKNMFVTFTLSKSPGTYQIDVNSVKSSFFVEDLQPRITFTPENWNILDPPTERLPFRAFIVVLAMGIIIVGGTLFYLQKNRRKA